MEKSPWRSFGSSLRASEHRGVCLRRQKFRRRAKRLWSSRAISKFDKFARTRVVPGLAGRNDSANFLAVVSLERAPASFYLLLIPFGGFYGTFSSHSMKILQILCVQWVYSGWREMLSGLTALNYGWFPFGVRSLRLNLQIVYTTLYITLLLFYGDNRHLHDYRWYWRQFLTAGWLSKSKSLVNFSITKRLRLNNEIKDIRNGYCIRNKFDTTVGFQ